MAALNPKRLPSRRGALTLALAWAAMLAAGCDSKPGSHTFHGVDITGADYAKALALSDPDGKTRSLDDWKGKVVVVFFGYTQCPDVCPTTLAELAEVRKALGADGDKLQGVFVTVDPDRDSAALLKEYVNNFGAGFVGLRGTPEQTAATAKSFKVFYSKVPGKTDTSYTMDHTAGSYVFDPQGRVRLFERHGTGVKFLAEDIKALLAGA